PRRALEEPLLDQVGLVEVLERPAVLTDSGGEGVEPGGTAVVVLDQGAEDLAVDLVEAVLVDLEEREATARGFAVDGLRPVHLREVAHAAQQPVGDARRAAAAPRDLERALGVDGDAQQRRRARDDARELLGRIEVEAVDDAETLAQRRGDETRARRRADEGE